jgi:hypothetical protein
MDFPLVASRQSVRRARQFQRRRFIFAAELFRRGRRRDRADVPTEE